MNHPTSQTEGITYERRIELGLDQPKRYDWAEDPTAQDVIDALRVVAMAQKDPAELAKILDCILEFAPETDSSRGIDLLLRMISEGTLKVSLVDH